MKKLLIGAAMTALAGAALAQTPTPPAPGVHGGQHRMMMQQPQTRDAAIAMVREHFAKMDTNRDGYLTDDEMKAQRAERAGKWRERRAERAPRASGQRDPAAAFDRLDANKDGMISRDEFAKAREMRVERRVEMRGDTPRAVGGKRMMRMHRMGGMGHGGMMKRADANNDGKVSLAEAQAAAVARFDRLDLNRDGTITPEERRQAHEKMRAMRAPKAS